MFRVFRICRNLLVCVWFGKSVLIGVGGTSDVIGVERVGRVGLKRRGERGEMRGG